MTVRSSAPRTIVSSSRPSPALAAVERLVERPRSDRVHARRPRRSGRRARGRPGRPGCRARPRAPGCRHARAGRPRGAAGAQREAARSPRPAARVAATRRDLAARRARAIAWSAGTARIRPPSARTALIPSSRPAPSTSGPPEDPRGSGAVCSIAPLIRRPRGPRKLRAVDDTNPGVTRRPRPPGIGEGEHRASDRQRSSASSDHSIGSMSAVSASITARSRSASEAEHTAGLAPAVKERDGDLVAAEVVGVGEDPPGADHEPGAASPALAEPDHRGAEALGRRLDRLSSSSSTVIRISSLLAICKSQL